MLNGKLKKFKFLNNSQNINIKNKQLTILLI